MNIQNLHPQVGRLGSALFPTVSRFILYPALFWITKGLATDYAEKHPCYKWRKAKNDGKIFGEDRAYYLALTRNKDMDINKEPYNYFWGDTTIEIIEHNQIECS